MTVKGSSFAKCLASKVMGKSGCKSIFSVKVCSVPGLTKLVKIAVYKGNSVNKVALFYF